MSTHLWVAIVLIDEVKDILKPWVGSHRGECEGVVIDGYGGVGIEGYGGGYGGEVGNRNGRVRKVVCMVTGIDEVGIGNGCCNHVWSWRRSPVGIDPVRGRRREGVVVVWIEHRVLEQFVVKVLGLKFMSDFDELARNKSRYKKQKPGSHPV